MIPLVMLVASLLVAQEKTYTVTVTVSGMRWGQRCGGLIKEALAGLDKAAKVGRGAYKEGSGVGTYPVTLPDTAKFEYTMLEKAIHRRYVIERVQVRIEGDITRDDSGTWLTTAGGSRFLLRNRPRKDDKDAPPDVLAKIADSMKAGAARFAIEGDATVFKENTVVRLESAQAVEKKSQ